MNANRLRVLSICVLLSAGVNLCGGLVAPQSFLELEQTADLIVNGTITGVSVRNGAAMNFSVQISRVIKGDTALTGNSIAAYWVSANQAAAGTGSTGGVSGSGIWFLQRAASAWRVIPVLQGTMDLGQAYLHSPAGPILSAYAYGQDASVEDKLASEISSAIESEGYNSQMYALQAEVIDELKSPVLKVLYQRMADSTSPEQRALGLSGLIRAGSASAVTAAAQAISTVGGSPAEGVLLLSIRDHFRATDGNSVVAIGRAAVDSSNPSIGFREAAAHALAAIHTAAALPFLATLLDDPDFNLQVEAVGGMGAFANGLAVQTSAGVASLAYLQLPKSAPYRTADTVAHLAFGRQAIAANKESYLAFWKSWWAQNRAGLGY